MLETTHQLAAHLVGKLGGGESQELRSGRCFRLQTAESATLLKVYEGARAMEQARCETRFLDRHCESVGYGRLRPPALADVPDEVLLSGRPVSWALFPWIPDARQPDPLAPHSLAFVARFATLVEALPLPDSASAYDWGLHSRVIRARLARANSPCREARELVALMLDTAVPLVEERLERSPRSLRWCHGDLKPHNVLELPGARFCVVDWESVHLDVSHYDRTYFFVEGVLEEHLDLSLGASWDRYARLVDVELDLDSIVPLAVAIVSAQLAALLARGNSPRSDPYMQGRRAVLDALLATGCG